MNGRRRRTATDLTYGVDPRVPSVDLWPTTGIVGQIGSGSHLGSWVLVDTYLRTDGAIESYDLLLPVDHLLDDDGEILMSNGSHDVVRPAGEGGLIDFLTTALDITWTVDEKVIDQRWNV